MKQAINLIFGSVLFGLILTTGLSAQPNHTKWSYNFASTFENDDWAESIKEKNVFELVEGKFLHYPKSKDEIAYNIIGLEHFPAESDVEAYDLYSAVDDNLEIVLITIFESGNEIQIEYPNKAISYHN